MSEIEDKLARLQAEVDETYEQVDRSEKDRAKSRDAERRKAKEELVEEIESLGTDAKSKALAKAAGSAVSRLDGKKAIVGGAALLLLVLFVLKNIWFILFGAAGLGGLWYLLSEWGKDGDDGEDEEDD